MEEHDPVPLAIFDRNCRWRSIPTDTLDKANLNWRIAYLTENFASYKAAIRSGLAVGLATALSACPGHGDVYHGRVANH